MELNNELRRVSQRTVNENLGRNKTKDHDIIYDAIEQKMGKTKICKFGCNGCKGGIKHEGDAAVSIRDFELKGVTVNPQNEVIIEKGDGLQGYCRTCSQKYRKFHFNDS